MSRALTLGIALALVAEGCRNAGEDAVLSISASGTVGGLVYFDRNGNRVLDGADTALSNLSIRLVARGTRDTVARTRSGATGSFRFSSVPVGNYTLSIDTTSLPGDSLRVTRTDTSAMTVRPDDTLAVGIAVGFPQMTVAQARAEAIGKKVFLVGLALNTRGIFGDSIVHLADTTAAMRLTAVRSIAVAAGDSIRVLGTRSTRDGQPTLNQVTVFTLAINAVVPVVDATTAVASGADNGLRDAALLKVANVKVTDTSTVQGNRRLVVDDGSGALEVRLDTIVGFRGAALAGDTIGAQLDVTGLLAPIGPGSWRLKPRSVSDVTHR